MKFSLFLLQVYSKLSNICISFPGEVISNFFSLIDTFWLEILTMLIVFPVNCSFETYAKSERKSLWRAR